MSDTANTLLVQNFVNSLTFVVPENNSGLKACTVLHTTVCHITMETVGAMMCVPG